MDIPIDKFKVWRDWRDAPVGAVLLIKAHRSLQQERQEQQQIVLRTEYREPGKPAAPAYVALLGPEAGRLRFGGQMALSVIDVSELVTLQISKALLTPANPHSVDAGRIYSAGSDAVPVMFVTIPDLGNSFYVPLTGEKAGQNTQPAVSLHLGTLEIIDKATEKAIVIL
jgi:hypothetical protein